MGRPLRILVVDDYPEDRELTLQQLRRHLIANPIEAVESGEECLARLRDADRPAIDLILLDARLPRMSGDEVTAAIRDDPGLAHVRVIMLTNLAPGRTAAGTPRGPDGLLDKPLQPNSLFRALKRIGSYDVVIESRDE